MGKRFENAVEHVVDGLEVVLTILKVITMLAPLIFFIVALYFMHQAFGDVTYSVKDLAWAFFYLLTAIMTAITARLP